MQLKALSIQDIEQVRQWRNDLMSMNRTPFLLTESMQVDFYHNVICNRLSNARYWGIWEEVNKNAKYEDYITFNGSVSYAKKDLPGFPVMTYNPFGLHGHDTEQLKTAVDMLKKQGAFIGMGEIENISWENRLGEIGLIMHPGYWDKAQAAIDMIIEQGFDYLNLENIFGEAYGCNPYIKIWEDAAIKYNAKCCYLSNRKYWQGQYYDSLYFNINKGDWKHE